TPETFRKNNAISKSISNNITIPVLKQDLDVTIPVLKQNRQDLNKTGIFTNIPDKYEIKTNLSGLSVKCKTEYQPTGNISYTISWVNPYGDIISSSSMISATRIKAPVNRKHSYIELESESQKNKRIALVAKNLNIQIVDLFHNHRFIDSSSTMIIDLESIKLNIANKAITLDYLTKNKDQQKTLYFSCSVLTTSDPIILYSGDKINIKIGGDGRNVGRKQSHIILAISILNE
ncbi:16059_t:CDS:2, partial [Racocetra persica]